MTPSSERRERAYTPRSRSGCATCRRRKIKCGEERPECQRCMYSGWRCPGYQKRSGQSSSAVSEGDILESVRTDSQEGLAGKLLVSRYALPFKIPGSKDERRALHYFNVFAAANMTGVVPNDFWSRIILQRCQHAAPLRHGTAVCTEGYKAFFRTS